MSPAEVHDHREAWRERERRADWRFGMLAAAISNPYRDSARQAQPFHPADFFPSLEDMRPPPPSDEELASKIEAALGGA